MTSPRALHIVAAVLLAAACTKGLLTTFPHRVHLADQACGGAGQRACLDCGSCHQSAKRSTWAPPRAERCTGCHADANELLARASRPALAPRPAAKAILFDHSRHLSLAAVRGQCVGCHAGAVGDELGAPLFPPMATCVGCHEHAEGSPRGACSTCHRAEDLRTLKPTSVLSHDAAWLRRHGLAARTDAAQCATCHATTSCDSCHDASRPSSAAQRNPQAIERELVHRFDFIGRHALEAESRAGQCVTCHSPQDCDACHAVRGVSASNRNAGSPHPSGWASGLGATRNDHGRAARRDIASCAACHDQGVASVCVSCHRVGGTGGSPHGLGWRSSESPTSPQCLPCHGSAP